MIPLGYLQGLPIAINLEDEAKKESHPAKLISDDALTPRTLTLKINEGTKFGTL